MSQAPASAKRRTLLTAAVCAPAIAVGALLTRQKNLAALPAPAPDATPAGVGYHETEHIRKYYRSAAYF
jgi:hypothetical protein